MEAHGKVHGIVRRQAHGGVHDVAHGTVHGRVHGRVRAFLGGSWLIGFEDTSYSHKSPSSDSALGTASPM